jgi:hypothetical protein
MRTDSPRITGPRIALAAIVLAALASAAIPALATGAPAATIEGTWRVEITLRHCQSGEALLAPFPALATFAQGGTMTTSDGGMSPAARGTGHGEWRRVQGRTFAAMTEAFMFASTGALSARQRITQEIVLHAEGTEFEARVSSQVVNLAGQVVFAGCATSVGRRLN